MFKSSLLIILALVVVASSAMAQDADVARLRNAALDHTFGARPSNSSFGLIDFSKLQFQHSYSLSFLSGGTGDGTVGLWNTTMFYEFSPKLSMALDVGVMHAGGALTNPDGNDATVLPGFMLDYHPSKNFSLSIGVSRVNPYYAPSRFNSVGFGGYNGWWLPR
jgi:hypothetical protein